MIAAFRKRPTWFLFPLALVVAVSAICVFTGPVSRAQELVPAPATGMHTGATLAALAGPETPTAEFAAATPASGIDQKLAHAIPLDVSDVPLFQFIDVFSKNYDLDVDVNWKALETVGIGRDTKVSAHFRSITARKALEVVLHNVGSTGNGTDVADFLVDDGIITISSAHDISILQARKKAAASAQAAGHRSNLGSGATTPIAVTPNPAPTGVTTVSSTSVAVPTQLGTLMKQLEDLRLERDQQAQKLGPLNPIITMLDHQMANMTQLLQTQMTLAQNAATADATHDAKATLKTYDVHDILDVPPAQSTVLTADQQGSLRDLVASLQTLIKSPNVTISAVNGTLLVKAPDDVQGQVREILDQLFEAHAKRVAQVRAEKDSSAPKP